jgi:hypothetical protein
MSAMAKHRGESSPRPEALQSRPRRKRHVADNNRAFVRAFADALRDILTHESHERRRFA